MAKVSRQHIEQQVLLAFRRRGLRVIALDILSVNTVSGEWRIGRSLFGVSQGGNTRDYGVIAAEVEAELQPLYTMTADEAAFPSHVSS